MLTEFLALNRNNCLSKVQVQAPLSFLNLVLPIWSSAFNVMRKGSKQLLEALITE